MDRLLNFTAALGLLLFLLVLMSVRRAHIRVEYSVSWLAAAIALIALSQAPGLLDAASRELGIESRPLALALVVGCVFLIIFYRLTVIISRLKDDNIALAQKVASLEYRLESLGNIPK